jgi:hypothetical protein
MLHNFPAALEAFCPKSDMISLLMSQTPALQFIIPQAFNQDHNDALFAYLVDARNLATADWQQIYTGVDLLNKAQIVTPEATRTFRQVYDEFIGRPFANRYIEQLLETNNVIAESPRVTAQFARQINPILRKAGLLKPNVPYSVLLQGYCLYWWQSFTRGYAFEVYIMRDLTDSGIKFQMHDVRNWVERYSPADLTVLGLFGDIKTSVYFLQWQKQNRMSNDFYITRLYEKGRERTLVVFQKPDAWDTIEGGTTMPGTLETVLDLLPTPVQIKLRDIILIVVDYETWKQMVHQKQLGEGT